MRAVHAKTGRRHDCLSEVGMLSKVRRFMALSGCWSISSPPDILNSISETGNARVQEIVSVILLPCNQFEYVSKVVRSFQVGKDSLLEVEM